MDPVLFELGPIRLWYYGLAYAIGFLTIDQWVRRRRGHLGWSQRDVSDFSLLFIVSAVLGGRAFDIVFYEWNYYEEHPWQLLSFWRGGMASHGVLLGAVVGTALFCWLRDKSFLEIADEVVIPGAFLLALGRLGNHINGEVYGYVTDVSWAVEFPYMTGYRHPVALYEGAKNLLLVFILLYVRRRNPHRPRGLLLGHFVFWYGFLRLFVDHFREYEAYWLGIGTGQYFNLLAAALGLGIIFGSRRVTGQVPEESGEPQSIREEEGPGFWVKRVSFYALVAFCLSIPSGTTQEVLKGLAMIF
jgi:phosphatidylglycerol---prolipoprotein diacylglyceryl transferase